MCIVHFIESGLMEHYSRSNEIWCVYVLQSRPQLHAYTCSVNELHNNHNSIFFFVSFDSILCTLTNAGISSMGKVVEKVTIWRNKTNRKKSNSFALGSKKNGSISNNNMMMMMITIKKEFHSYTFYLLILFWMLRGEKKKTECNTCENTNRW